MKTDTEKHPCEHIWWTDESRRLLGMDESSQCTAILYKIVGKEESVTARFDLCLRCALWKPLELKY